MDGGDVPAAPFGEVLLHLKEGRTVSDRVFDSVLAPQLRECSAIHWTPVAVARAAVGMLVDRPGVKVLDVGCGPGKLCIIGATISEGIFTGVDRRLGVVEDAQRICREHGVERAHFIHGEMEQVDWNAFDAFYFYNPFGEHQLAHEEQIDFVVEPSTLEFERCVQEARERLRAARTGTRVVTYHGFGEAMPREYHLIAAQHFGYAGLKLWERRDVPRPKSMLSTVRMFPGQDEE